MQCLSTAHAFDYTALRINSGLTSCKDLTTVKDNSLDNNGPYSLLVRASYFISCSAHA